MPMYVWSGGQWRESQDIYPRDGGQWRATQRGWVRNNSQWRLFQNFPEIVYDITITSGTSNAQIYPFNYPAAEAALNGAPPGSKLRIFVPSGSFVRGSFGDAMTIGQWDPAIDVELHVDGFIAGQGGVGGVGPSGTGSPSGATFLAGRDALQLQQPVRLFGSGIIGGGGGGGGSGAGAFGGGGGGGAGFGEGGDANSGGSGQDGSNGSLSTGGNGGLGQSGAGRGGNGGDLGQNGESGPGGGGGGGDAGRSVDGFANLTIDPSSTVQLLGPTRN